MQTYSLPSVAVTGAQNSQRSPPTPAGDTPRRPVQAARGDNTVTTRGQFKMLCTGGLTNPIACDRVLSG